MGQFSNSNDYLSGRKPVPVPAGGEVVACRFPLTLATGDLDTNDIGAIGILPAGCVPVEAFYDSDDLDSATALVLSIGIGNLALTNAAGAVSSDAKDTLISTKAADGGAAWATGITTGQAVGQVSLAGQPISRVTAVNYDRHIVAKVTTGAGTAVAGEVGLTLLYRAA